MSIANAIDDYFKRTGQSVFIEAEGKTRNLLKFLYDYNMQYYPNIDLHDDGIICLDDSKNKWGLELRCYFYDANDFPYGVQVTSNRVYRPTYPYRFNDVDIIKDLFELGYRIGEN